MKEGIDTAIDRESIVHRGAQVIAIERDALERTAGHIGEAFAEAVELIESVQGTVVLTGIGKSGIIARKISATLNSTGTPSLYLHPSDALHGDLGAVREGDVIVVLSKSGSGREIESLLPAIRQRGVPIVAVTGNPDSTLGRNASIVLDASVEREACLYDIAPTSSTTAMLALGDALAVVLYERSGFDADGFAETHPGGVIGLRLNLKVSDVMRTGNDIPRVSASTPFKDVILEMSSKRVGATLVADRDRLIGIITDGDLRRLLEREDDYLQWNAETMMTREPMSAPKEMAAANALELLEETRRTHLPVVSADLEIQGIVHIHDLLSIGLQT